MDGPNDPTRRLAQYLADLCPGNVPEVVSRRAEELFLDWMASTLAGWRSPPVPLFDRFARQMGPDSGRSQILGARRMTSPYFAALVNAASSHTLEQDDLHNGSVLHPGTVVFPAVLAAAQDIGVSGEAMLIAAIAGYEAGIRIGEFLGRSHYRIFHTTGTVGTLAAAAGVGKILGFDADQFVNALGNAGTQAAGLWEFLRDGANSKQLHAAKAAADGLLSAYMAAGGLTGASRVLDGAQGLAKAMSRDADPTRLTDRLGERWATVETSFKLHACCRHAHPAADALSVLMQAEGLCHTDLVSVVTHVHQAALDVLGSVVVPCSIHQAKFSMGTVLGLIAVHGAAGLEEFEQFALSDRRVAAVRDLVTMEFDSTVDAAYPSRWRGLVTVNTRDGRTMKANIEEPKGDPGNTLRRPELEQKMRRLAKYSRTMTEDAIDHLICYIWNVRRLPVVGEIPILEGAATVGG
jgi:2-methylcitrate dehydratase PrpD